MYDILASTYIPFFRYSMRMHYTHPITDLDI